LAEKNETARYTAFGDEIGQLMEVARTQIPTAQLPAGKLASGQGRWEVVST
jgi:hypothetical protein